MKTRVVEINTFLLKLLHKCNDRYTKKPAYICPRRPPRYTPIWGRGCCTLLIILLPFSYSFFVSSFLLCHYVLPVCFAPLQAPLMHGSSTHRRGNCIEPRRFAPKIPNDRITKQTPCLACLRGCPVLVCRAVSISSSSSGQQLLFFVLLALRAKALFLLYCAAERKTLPPYPQRS